MSRESDLKNACCPVSIIHARYRNQDLLASKMAVSFTLGAPIKNGNTAYTYQETNRSFVLRAVKDVVLEDRPVPVLKDPWDVRVHVAQTGICGSDVHYWQRGRIGGI